MSIQCLAWVLEQEPLTKGTDRLVLLSLANHADELWRAWPSVPRIAREANVADRAVQRSLANLTRLGIISVERQGAPDKRISADRRPNLYYIHRGVAHSTPRGDAHDTPERSRGVAGGADGVSLVTERGATSDTQTVIDPKEEPSAPGGGEPPRPSPEQVGATIRDIRSKLRGTAA